MKTKVSKKMLSVLLAVLMIITSVPVSVFAFSIDADIDAASDPAVIEVSNAMTAYEKKMDGKLYKNMTAAYNAYVDAYKAIDQYVYGGVKNALEGKAKALNDAVAAMGSEWTLPTFDAKAMYYNQEAVGGYSNIVYCSPTTNITNGNNFGWGTASRLGWKIVTPNVMVGVYDGTNAVKFPIVTEVIGGDNNDHCVYYIDMSGTASENNNCPVALDTNWQGYMQENNHSWQSWPGSNIDSAETFPAYNNNKNTYTSYFRNVNRFYWNTLNYNGTGDTSSYYEKAANNVYYISASNKVALTWHDVNNSQGANYSNYIINYAPVIPLYNAIVAKYATAFEGNHSVADYKQGGLAEMMAAIDKLTDDSINPKTYSYNDSNAESSVQTCATAIKNYVDTYTEPSVGSRDDKTYESLRAAMNKKMAAYNNGVNDGLTDESYAELKTAYENAMDIMRNGYGNPTGAQDAADILNALILVTKEDHVDTTELMAVIDAFEAYEHIFTEGTYNAVAAAVLTAKETVWSAENKYGDPNSSLLLSEENTAIVAAQVEVVGNAVKALRIDADSVVATQYGRYSINDAIALITALNPDDWSNSGDMQIAVNKANEYIAKAALTDLTDYTVQYNEYVAEIEKVVAAYNARKATFMSIPNGLAFKNDGINYLTDMTRNDQGTVGVGFSYTNKAVVFRKTHEALNTTYGSATIKMLSGIKNGSSTPLANNMLDSININATDDASTGYINGFSGASSKPPALNDPQNSDNTKGCLTYAANGNSTFALEKLRFAGRSDNNNCPRYFTLVDGTEIIYGNDNIAYSTDLTEILGTTQGAASDPGRGGVFARTSNNDLATTYVNADMTFSLPATDAPALTASTTPITVTNYVMRTNFSAVVLRNVQNMTAVSGYERFTSVTNNEKIYTQVEVIDISYLVDLINMCNNLLKTDSAKYTDVSLKNFTDALSKAQEELDYNNVTMTSNTIVDRCKTRYTNLWDAYKALELKKLAVTFNYKNADGTDASTVINVTPGHSLSEYADEVNAISTPQWISADGAYKYTFKEWNPAFDVNAAIIIDTTFTAVYDSESNLADFIAYNNAKATLLGKLTDETYTTADLQALNTAIGEMIYFTYTDEQKAATMGTEQAAINAETAKLVELAENLTPSTVDVSSAQALVEKAKAEAGIDEDVYNLGALDFSYTSDVTVGDETVVGLTFGSQDDVDAALRDALNASNLNKRIYTVYLNDVAVGTAEYGSPVIVDSNGNFAKDVSDMDADISDNAKQVAWSYSYAAPSRNNAKSEPKYMLTASSLGFIVKGDTYLTTANAAENEEGFVVKFATNDGKVFDVKYTTNGSVTVPAAPNYAFYTFTGYEGGYQAGDTVAVTENMTITAIYAADTSNSYTINFFPSYTSWDTGGEGTMVPGTYRYEELVTLSAPNAYCFVTAFADPDNDYAYEFKLIAYGSSYSFCACQNLGDEENLTGIVALTKAEYDTILRGEATTPSTLLDGMGNEIKAIDEGYGQWAYPEAAATVSVLDEVVPVYNSSNKLSKFSMIGTFTLPEGYEIVEAGILFTSQQGSDLKVENVGKNGIARFKASRYNAGNQFVQNVWAPSDGRVVSFDYAAYAIVKDANGNLKTIYSKTVAGTTQGL